MCINIKADCPHCGTNQEFHVTKNEMKQETLYFCRECKKTGEEWVVVSIRPFPS